MAASIPTTTVSRTLATIASIAQAANVAGDTFLTTAAQWIYINNGGGSGITLTVTIQSTVDGQAVTNKTYTIANGQAYLLGPFNPSVYGDSGALVHLGYSAVTSVTVACFQLGSP